MAASDHQNRVSPFTFLDPVPRRGGLATLVNIRTIKRHVRTQRILIHLDAWRGGDAIEREREKMVSQEAEAGSKQIIHSPIIPVQGWQVSWKISSISPEVQARPHSTIIETTSPQWTDEAKRIPPLFFFNIHRFQLRNTLLANQNLSAQAQLDTVVLQVQHVSVTKLGMEDRFDWTTITKHSYRDRVII